MSIFSFSEKQFDPETFQLEDEEGQQTLRAKTAGLLWLFLKHPGEALTRQFLLDENWDGMAVGDHVLSETLRELRAALGDSPRKSRFIRTIPKHGYQWVWTDIEQIEPNPEPGPLPASEIPEPHIRVAVPQPSTAKRNGLRFFVVVCILLLAGFMTYRWNQTRIPDSPLGADRGAGERSTARLGILPLQRDQLDDRWFDDGYQDLLQVALSDLDRVEVVDGKVVRTQASAWLEEREPDEAPDSLRFADLLGLTDLLEIQIACEETVCRVTYQLTDGAGSLRQKGRFAAENREDAVMTLAGLLAKHYGHTVGQLPALQALDDLPEVQAAFARGMHYASSGLPKRAAEQFQYCLRLAPEFHWARYKLANTHFKTGEMDTSQALLNEVLNQPELSSRLKSHVINSLGAQQLTRGEVSEAAISFGDAANHFLELGDHGAYLKSLGNQVVAAVYQGDPDTAMQLLKQGLALAENRGLKRQKGQFLSRLAGIQLMEGNYDGARTNLNQARLLYRQMGDLAGAAGINNNLGAIALEQNQPEEANTYFTLAWRQYEDLGLPAEAALAMHNQGTCALMLKDVALAEKLTRTAMNTRERNKNRFGLAESYAQLARISAARAQDAESLEQLNQAEAIFAELGRSDVTQHYAEKIILNLLALDARARATPYLVFYPEDSPRLPGFEVTLLLAEQAQLQNEQEKTQDLLEKARAMKPQDEWPEAYQTLFANALPKSPAP